MLLVQSLLGCWQIGTACCVLTHIGSKESERLKVVYPEQAVCSWSKVWAVCVCVSECLCVFFFVCVSFFFAPLAVLHVQGDNLTLTVTTYSYYDALSASNRTCVCTAGYHCWIHIAVMQRRHVECTYCTHYHRQSCALGLDCFETGLPKDMKTKTSLMFWRFKIPEQWKIN